MDDKSPREVSYWLASIFAQNPYAQQALLEVLSSPIEDILCVCLAGPHLLILRAPSHQHTYPRHHAKRLLQEPMDRKVPADVDGHVP